MDVEQFETVTATWQPRVLDTIRPKAQRFVGWTGCWEAFWMIEDGPYAGEWAMMAMTADGENFAESADFGWVPSGDLVAVR